MLFALHPVQRSSPCHRPVIACMLWRSDNGEAERVQKYDCIYDSGTNWDPKFLSCEYFSSPPHHSSSATLLLAEFDSNRFDVRNPQQNSWTQILLSNYCLAQMRERFRVGRGFCVGSAQVQNHAHLFWIVTCSFVVGQVRGTISLPAFLSALDADVVFCKSVVAAAPSIQDTD